MNKILKNSDSSPLKEPKKYKAVIKQQKILTKNKRKIRKQKQEKKLKLGRKSNPKMMNNALFIFIVFPINSILRTMLFQFNLERSNQNEAKKPLDREDLGILEKHVKETPIRTWPLGPSKTLLRIQFWKHSNKTRL